MHAFKSGRFELLGAIPANPALQAFRTCDVARHLNAEVIWAGDMTTRRVFSFALCARTVAHIHHVFSPGALLIMPADRDDVILGAALTALNGVALAGIVLTGDTELSPGLQNLCQRAFDTGLPVLKVRTGSYQTALNISRVSSEVPPDDTERMNHVMDFIARNISGEKLENRCKVELVVRMSPAAFRHKLASRARASWTAASSCRRATSRGPSRRPSCAQARHRPLCPDGKPGRHPAPGRGDRADAARRPSRSSTPTWCGTATCRSWSRCGSTRTSPRTIAVETLEDNVYLGTIMLAKDEADGLVAGAIHSTANTIRPALQLIKTRARRARGVVRLLHVPARPGAGLWRLRGESESEPRGAGRHRDPERGKRGAPSGSRRAWR